MTCREIESCDFKFALFRWLTNDLSNEEKRRLALSKAVEDHKEYEHNKGDRHRKDGYGHHKDYA